jgi:hypothetical protein
MRKKGDHGTDKQKYIEGLIMHPGRRRTTIFHVLKLLSQLWSNILIQVILFFVHETNDIPAPAELQLTGQNSGASPFHERWLVTQTRSMYRTSKNYCKKTGLALGNISFIG